MIVDQGVSILAINTDAEKVLVEGPDGQTQVCDVLKWFSMTGNEVKSWQFAETFGFEVHGFSARGETVTQRYDGRLQGMGQAITRNPDGSFGEGRRAGQRLEALFEQTAAREGLPPPAEHHSSTHINRDDI